MLCTALHGEELPCNALRQDRADTGDTEQQSHEPCRCRETTKRSDFRKMRNPSHQVCDRRWKKHKVAFATLGIDHGSVECVCGSLRFPFSIFSY
jgi:hypothetical protein